MALTVFCRASSSLSPSAKAAPERNAKKSARLEARTNELFLAVILDMGAPVFSLTQEREGLFILSQDFSTDDRIGAGESGYDSTGIEHGPERRLSVRADSRPSRDFSRMVLGGRALPGAVRRRFRARHGRRRRAPERALRLVQGHHRRDAALRHESRKQESARPRSKPER